MPLSDIKCKAAKPTDKPRKISDSNGLYLEIMPTGSKYWRLKYRFAGKEKRLALGVYPEVTLGEARNRKDQARKMLANNIDPSAAKKEAKIQKEINSENNFETIARLWHENQKAIWTPKHANRVIKRMEADFSRLLASGLLMK